MAEVRIKDIDEHEIDTILAEDIDFEGRLSFKKPLMIKGKFRGEIKSSSSLYVGEKAYVEATLEAGVVSSKGRIKGNILGHSRVELFSTSQVDGDISTPDFVAESGCKFNGYCDMSGGAVKREAVRSAASAQAPQQSSKPAATQAQAPQARSAAPTPQAPPQAKTAATPGSGGTSQAGPVPPQGSVPGSQGGTRT